VVKLVGAKQLIRHSKNLITPSSFFHCKECLQNVLFATIKMQTFSLQRLTTKRTIYTLQNISSLCLMKTLISPCPYANQCCQMVYFKTKNLNLGKFWKVLQWKMLVIFMAISSILRSNGILYDQLVHFHVIWYICSRFGML
jgi:hypothetical protein